MYHLKSKTSSTVFTIKHKIIIDNYKIPFYNGEIKQKREAQPGQQTASLTPTTR